MKTNDVSRRVPNQVLAAGVLAGFIVWVLAPALTTRIAGSMGASDATIADLLYAMATVATVLFIAVLIRTALSPVHAARGDQPPRKLVLQAYTDAPWRRARLTSRGERLMARINHMRGRPDAFNEVRRELERIYQSDPALALELYREWAHARGASTVPVVTKAGVLGRWVKSAWSEAFQTRPLRALLTVVLVVKSVVDHVTEPIVRPAKLLGTRLAFVARPWGGARMTRLRYRDTAPRGAFVLDLAPILVLAALSTLITAAELAIANL